MLFRYLSSNTERPIREYELLSNVEASWNKDKMVNIFVIKKTPLAPILHRKVRTLFENTQPNVLTLDSLTL